MSPTRVAFCSLRSLFVILFIGLSNPQAVFSQPDDAKAAGKAIADFPELTIDVFKEMDGGVALSPEEIKGRNTWIIWTAGGQVFLDRMARESYGIIDVLKTIDSRNRDTRFARMGLINEPGFKKAENPDEFGLWLDVPINPAKDGLGEVDSQIAKEYEGTAIDWKQWVYGRSTGVMGLRIFPNPDFFNNEEARTKWDANRYYDPNDGDYWADRELIRPYRVGMTCGVCHVAHHPLNPPADPESPKWNNLASAIGNQYLREGYLFAINLRKRNFLYQMIQQQPAGTSDTSRIATDHINNPNAINAIFNVPSRLEVANAHSEQISAESGLLPGDGVDQAGMRKVPRILKDGADSIGVPAASIRVYVNIGMYSQHWLTLHNPLVGVRAQTPFTIDNAQKNSVYWMATQERLSNMKSFLASVNPFHLKDAKGTGSNDKDGSEFITKDANVLRKGKIVFSQYCAKCHSSKRAPNSVFSANAWYAKSLMSEDFLDDNFLSDDKRYPASVLKTNASRALATNAMRGNIWDNFSSETYKKQRSVGEITVFNPLTGKYDYKFVSPNGGVGYYRTPSLISLWTSAPFFHNNALGKYTGDPSVRGRMAAFDDAAEKLLWPEKRLNERSIWRTQEESWLEFPRASIPPSLAKALAPITDKDGYVRLGPIPAGTPINLLANLNIGEVRDASDVNERLASLISLVTNLKKQLAATKGMTPDQARNHINTFLVSALMKASKCPDLIEDRGHYFGTSLSDKNKRALIEFLKLL